MSTRLLIVTFHEIVIRYETDLKTQFDLIDITTNDNVGLPRSLPLKFCQMIYLFKMFIMFWRISIYAFGYDLSKILAKLVISVKHNIIFAKFLEMLLDNNITSSHTYIRWQSKNHLEVIWVYKFSDSLLKALSHQNVFKNALEKFSVPRFNEINRNH